MFRKEWGREVRGYSVKEEEEEEAAGVPFKCVSEERQRYMQISPKEHLNGLSTEWLKGCRWVPITKHKILSEVRVDVQAWRGAVM